MLTIRREQVAALTAGRRERFIREAAARLREHFPGAAAGEEPSRWVEATRVAVARAEARGLVSPRDVTVYLNLCAALGWDFEERAEHAGVVALLDGPAAASPSERARVAFEALIRRATLAAREQATRASFESLGRRGGP